MKRLKHFTKFLLVLAAATGLQAIEAQQNEGENVPGKQPAETPATNTVPAAKTAPSIAYPEEPAPPSAQKTNLSAKAAPAPSAPAKTNASAVASFRTRPGFKIELVASTPTVSSPAAMAFDEDGRLFVAEMRDYPSQRSRQPHLGQIRVLEDNQAEGIFSSSTVFATNLPLPSAVICYGGGVFVAAAPDILFLQDTDGDGIADVRRVVFTGFGDRDDIDANLLPHSFYWGMDNRIYGASGGAAEMVTTMQNKSRVLLRRKDFSFDPRQLTLDPEAGLALSGMTRDDWGRRFLCSNTRPLQVELIEERYVNRNPFFAPAALVENAAGPAIPVYRDPPMRTTPATLKLGTNTIAPTWMVNARGAVVYRGTLFPSNYLGNVFVADADARVIHRMVLRQQGFALQATRAPDETSTEFVVCSDPVFRPTQMITGPDGALYVADMASGGDDGRIFRISTSAYVPSKPQRLSQATTRELVAMLAHTNSYHRDTASRLLFEQRDPEAVPLLTSMATRSRVPLARADALMALAGAGALTDTLTSQALTDTDWRVRVKAVSLLEGFVQEGAISDVFWARLRSLATDANAQVRFQTALTSGAINRFDRPALLRDVLARDPANPWVQTAVLSAAHDRGAALLELLANEPRIPGELKDELLERIADMVGVSGNMNEVQGVIDYILGEGVPELVSLNLTGALGEGLQRTRSSLRLVDSTGRLALMFSSALYAAGNWRYREPARLGAIRVLGTGPYTMDDGGAVLLAILNSGEPPSIQSAALRSLSYYDSPQLVPGIVERWGAIAPALRGQAISTLLSRGDQVAAVMALIQEGTIPAADVSPWQANILRHWPEPNVSQRAVEVFGPPGQDRAAVMDKLRPVAGLTGTAAAGQGIFANRCAVCHNIRGSGQVPGPDLAGVKVLGKEGMLESIIMPSRRIAPGYAPVILTAATGQVAVGTVLREAEQAVVIREPGRDPVVWPRLNVVELQPQQWSLMPERLEQGLSNRELADLLQFLLTVR